MIWMLATAAVILAVPDVVERAADLDGRVVRVRGWLGPCAHLDCRLYVSDDARRVGSFERPLFLSIGSEPGFDARAAQFVGKPVVIKGRVDDECITGICVDRAADIRPQSIALDRHPLASGSR